MKQVMAVYFDHPRIQVSVLIVAFLSHSIAWLCGDRSSGEWTFWGIAIALLGILVAAVKSLVSRQWKKAREETRLFLLASSISFLIIVIFLSPMRFRSPDSRTLYNEKGHAFPQNSDEDEKRNRSDIGEIGK